MSDSKTPTVVSPDNALELMLDETKNPFVIEGCLWDENGRLSVMIKFIDGKYIVSKTIVTEEELNGKSVGDVRTERKEYIAHRLEGVAGLCFLQYWEAEADAMCEGMKVLQPKKQVFVGFKK